MNLIHGTATELILSIWPCFGACYLTFLCAPSDPPKSLVTIPHFSKMELLVSINQGSHQIFIFLCFTYFSINLITSSSMYAATNYRVFLLLYEWIIFCCIDAPKFLYPHLLNSHFSFLHTNRYCEQCYNKQGCVNMFLIPCCFLPVFTKKKITENRHQIINHDFKAGENKAIMKSIVNFEERQACVWFLLTILREENQETRRIFGRWDGE